MNAASANMGGASTYLRHFLKFVPAETPYHEYVVYAPTVTIESIQRDGVTGQVELKGYPYRSSGGAARFFFDQVEIPRIVREAEIEVLFSSTGFATVLPGCPQILLIRNALLFEKRYRFRSASVLRRWLSTATFRRADLVLAPSEAMLTLLDRAPPSRVIPYGIHPESFLSDEPAPAATRTMRQWRSAGDFILLYVSSYARHKDFEALIEALSLLRSRGIPARLMTTLSREITGEGTAYDALVTRIGALGLNESVASAGYLPYGQLHHLYDEADLFAFPSISESFGHPMVEALASGLPVVAADTAVNREICGDAAMFFEPSSPMSIMRMIGMLYAEPEMRTELADRARVRARRYSWTRYARDFAAAVEEVVGRE